MLGNIELIEISRSIHPVLDGVFSLGLASNGMLVLVSSGYRQLLVVRLHQWWRMVGI